MKNLISFCLQKHIRLDIKISIFVLILALNFNSLTKADDIRDFEIEGISIGDSLLDYYTENEIINFIQDRQYPNSQRVKITKILSDDFKTYEAVSADFLNDGSYRIIKLSGRIFFRDNIKECHKKMSEIDRDIKEIFGNENRYTGDKKHRYDKSGRSTMKVIGYTLGKDDIQIQCTDWHESMEMYDSLSFMLFTEEWMNFLNNEAY